MAKLSEEFVNESFDTLPPALKTYLKGAGQGGKIVGDQHFLGYKTKDGEITSEVGGMGKDQLKYRFDGLISK